MLDQKWLICGSYVKQDYWIWLLHYSGSFDAIARETKYRNWKYSAFGPEENPGCFYEHIYFFCVDKQARFS